MAKPKTRKELRKEARVAKKQKKAAWFSRPKSERHTKPVINKKVQAVNAKATRVKPSATRAQDLGFSKDELDFADGKIQTSVEEANPFGEDAALVAYLEKKLGVKGDKSKSKKLFKQISKEEFGGDDLLDMVDGILDGVDLTNDDDLDIDVETDLEESSQEEMEETETGTDKDDESVDEEDHTSETNAESDADSASDDADSASDDAESASDDAESASDDAESASETAASSTKTGAYIPPHLRNKGAASCDVSEPTMMTLGMALTHLKPIIKSQFNRVAEGNLNVITDTLVKGVVDAKENLSLAFVSRDSPQSKLRETLVEFVSRVTDMMADEAMEMLKAKAGANLTAPQMALLAACAGLITPRVIPVFLARALRYYDNLMSKIVAYKQPEVLDTAFDQGVEWAEECRQALTAVSMLHYFGVIDSVFFTELLEYVSGNKTVKGKSGGEETPAVVTRRLEFLSLILRLTGPSLKVDCPQQFNGLVKRIESLLESVKDVTNMQVDFIRQELGSLSKARKAPMYEKFLAMRGWLQREKFKSVNWASIMFDPIDQQQAALSLFKGVVPKLNSSNDVERLSAMTRDDSKGAQLLAMARKLKIKSPLQQQAFVALVGADDVEDACVKLLRVATKNSQLSHVVAVILHCASQEKVYNEYYEKVLMTLCRSSDTKVAGKLTKAVREGLHTLVSALGDGTDRRKAILAKLYATLVKEEILPAVESLIKKFQ